MTTKLKSISVVSTYLYIDTVRYITIFHKKIVCDRFIPSQTPINVNWTEFY